jgi:VIT1/CCC1 family predicted Fe2+/Mn2+ transporter
MGTVSAERFIARHTLAVKVISMNRLYGFFLAVAIATVAVLPVARPVLADTTSTIAIAAAAGLIVGALLTDSNNQPYYVSNGRHVYVSQNTATYYRAHGNSHGHYQPNNQQRNNQQYHGNGGQQYH